MAQEDSRQEGRRAERWARVNFPNKFVHPHEYTARDGRVFDKMFVSIPPGVTLNGVDLGGYAFDHFAKPREIEQKANGRLGASMSEERGLYGALRSGGVADSFDYADYAYAAREDDDRQMWCSDDGYIVDVDLPNMPPLSARGLEDAVAALETGAAVMDPADPTNMAVTAAESGRSL